MTKNESVGNSVRSLINFSTDDFSFALSDYDLGLRQSWHTHEDLILVMTLRGLVREQVGAHDTLIKPFSVGIKPPGVRHTDHFSEKGVRVLRVSLSALFEAELRQNKVSLTDWEWSSSSLAIRPFLRLAGDLLYEKTDKTGAFDKICEVIAGVQPGSMPKTHKNAPAWLERSKRELDDTFSDGVRLSTLAREAKVHPVYYARKFRHHFGASVGGYVRQLQFRRAADLLHNSGHSLAEIAYMIGFSDQAHLTRALATEFGITPDKLRRLLR